MKKTLLLLCILSLAFSSCKKCYNCTYSFACSHCLYSNGFMTVTECNSIDNHQNYLQAQADCLANGATWVAESSIDSVAEFCSTSKSETDTRQAGCVQGGGTWASK